MSTPVDINRLKIQIKLGSSVMGQRSWSAELYLDNTSSPPITEYGAIKSERYANPNNFTEEAGFKLATAYLCLGGYDQYLWSIPSQCSDPTWLAKDFITVVIPPKPSIEPVPPPTPTPTSVPTGTEQNVTELPAVNNKEVVQQQKEARLQVNVAKKAEEELKKRSQALQRLKSTLTLAAPLAIAAAVRNNVRGAAAGAIAELAGSFAGFALKTVSAKISASNAQSASMADAVTSALNDQKLTVDSNLTNITIDNEQITNQIDTNIQNVLSNIPSPESITGR